MIISLVILTNLTVDIFNTKNLRGVLVIDHLFEVLQTLSIGEFFIFLQDHFILYRSLGQNLVFITFPIELLALKVNFKGERFMVHE